MDPFLKCGCADLKDEKSQAIIKNLVKELNFKSAEMYGSQKFQYQMLQAKKRLLNYNVDFHNHIVLNLAKLFGIFYEKQRHYISEVLIVIVSTPPPNSLS
ncbi:16903_t:CDS:2, partial [Dentiscutata heterogama]